MASSLLPGTPRIRPVGRYLNWNGRQGPMLGLGLPYADVLTPGLDEERLGRRWQELVSIAAEIGCDLILAPDGAFDEAPHWLAPVVASCARHSMALVLPLQRPATVADATTAGNRLAELAELHPGLVAAIDTSRARGGLRLTDHLELDLHGFLSNLAVPMLVVTRDPFGGQGRMVRALGRTAELTGVHLEQTSSVDELSLFAAALSVRLADRPAVMVYDGDEPDACSTAVRSGWVAGLAACIVRLPLPGTPSKQLIDSLTELAELKHSLPEELPEPEEEAAAVLVLDDGGQGPRQPIDAVLAALLLLQRGARLDSQLVFADQPGIERRPAFVHVPVHGALPAAAWSRCWSMARQGSEVLLTGLTLEGEETLRRLDELGVVAAPVADPSELKQPGWLAGRPILDTDGQIVSRNLDLGRLRFLDRCIEMRPSDQESLRLIRGAVHDAGLQASPWLAAGNGVCLRREMRFASGVLQADLTAGELRWLPSNKNQ